MKILKNGRGVTGHWVGRKLTCSTCDCCFQLEKGDHVVRLKEDFNVLFVRAANRAGSDVLDSDRKRICSPPQDTTPYSVRCPFCGEKLKFRDKKGK